MNNKTILFATMITILILNACIASADMNNVASIKINLVNQDPDPAIAGDVVEVRVGVQNIGGAAAENTFVNIKPEYPFSKVNEDDDLNINVGTIEGFQGKYDDNLKIIKFKLKVDKDASAGDYELKASHGEKGSGVSTESTLQIAVKNRESAEVIHIDKTNLIPGQQGPLKFTITNVGNAPLRDVTFNWENPDKLILPVGSDNTKYMKYIDMDDSAELTYQVIADGDAQAGLYQLDLHLSYDDTTGNKTGTKELTSVAGVYVGGPTDFDVAFSESASGQTSFTISNIGANPASSVSVIIPEQRAWRITGSNSMIIGNLNKGDYTVASFKLSPSQAVLAMLNATGNSGGNFRGRGGNNATGAAPGSMPQDRPMRPMDTNESTDSIKIQLAYTDTMGTRQTVEKTVKVGLQNVASADGTMAFAGAAGRGRTAATTKSTAQTIYDYLLENKWYTLGAVILIIAYMGYRRVKHKKIQDPNFKYKDIFSKKKR